MRSYLTDAHKAYIKIHAPTVTAYQIGKTLGINSSVVRGHILRCGLRCAGVQCNRKNDVDLSLFEKLDNPVMAYLMGYLWADGSRHAEHKGVYYTLAIEVLYDDGVYLESLMRPLLPIRTHSRERPGRRKQLTIQINSRALIKLLDECYRFDTKSVSSPTELLAAMSPDMRWLFLRGYLDGDGHIGRSGHIEWCGDYTLTWDWLTTICQEVGVPYKVRRRAVRGSKFSSFIISKQQHGLTLLQRIYASYPTDRLGLSRKHQRFREIQDRVNARPCGRSE